MPFIKFSVCAICSLLSTDLTWNMLTAAREANVKAGADDVIYLMADAENLPFPDKGTLISEMMGGDSARYKVKGFIKEG